MTGRQSESEGRRKRKKEGRSNRKTERERAVPSSLPVRQSFLAGESPRQ